MRFRALLRSSAPLLPLGLSALVLPLTGAVLTQPVAAQSVGRIPSVSGPRTDGLDPEPRTANRAPVFEVTLPQGNEILRNGPFKTALLTAVHSADDFVMFVRVTDPDGDAFQLELADAFPLIWLERVAGSPSDAIFQIRLEVSREFRNGGFEDNEFAPEQIVLRATDNGSPPATSTFVQKLRHQEGGTEVAVGDVTGDGLPDVIHRVFDEIQIFRSEGLDDPPVTIAPLFNYEGSVRLIDLSGDGILDITLERSWSGSGALLVHFGGPHIANGTLVGTFLGGGTGSTRVEFADVTGDGVSDVVMRNRSELNVWKGPLSSTPENLLSFSSVWPLETMRLADVTDDGVLDILVASRFQGDGMGSVDNGRINVFAGGPVLDQQPTSVLIDEASFNGDRLGEGIFVAEVTGDGMPDVLSWSRQADVGGVSNAGRLYVWEGPLAPGTLDVTARLARATTAANNNLELLRIAEVTGDDVMDILGTWNNGQNIAIFQGGVGMNGDITPSSFITSRLQELMDVNGDLVLDIVAEGNVWAGGPSLIATSPPPPTATLTEGGDGRFAMADITGDGTRDLIVGDLSGGLGIYDGSLGLSGVVSPSMHLVPPTGYGFPDRFELVDVSGDGILDVLANYFRAGVDGVTQAGAILAWNGGPGLGTTNSRATFARTAPQQNDLLGFQTSGGSELGFWVYDVNGDAIPDVLPLGILADVNGVVDQGESYLFLGGPSLSGRIPPQAAVTTLGQTEPEIRAIVDLDGDGRLDLIVESGTGSFDQVLYVWSDILSNPTAPAYALIGPS